MSSPLTLGSILQSRYRILSVLGQGGFGRTYLAEDLGRFQEQCAVKEYAPAQVEGHFSDKSKELFQREAAILYQIQHPQIPQFRATFEQDGRLFLVQDYVAGATYRALLNQRLTQGQAFTEAEVHQFLLYLCPVLAHIHSKGIIHRDITPDNIILRQADQRPVLIDFGVVKEFVTRLQSPSTQSATTVGKLGYAPSEQMQTGNAYPSSDLYSLAVTAIVLLTGREPQHLFDDRTATWRWEAWVQVSPTLAAVLNRALRYLPGDRFQSVAEMMQALQGQAVPLGATLPLTPAPTPVVPPSPVPVPPPVSPTPLAPENLSHLNTIAVGGRPGAAPPRSSRPAYGEVEPPSGWDSPWFVALVGLLLALSAGFGSWAVVRYWQSEQANRPTPTVTLTPTESPTVPTPTPTVSTPPTPVVINSVINLPLDQVQTLTGTLNANETINHQFAATVGQQLTVRLIGEGVLLSILQPDGTPLPQAERVLDWQGELPSDGQYTIQIKPVQGLTSSAYELETTLSAAIAPSPSPTVTLSPSPSPSPTAPMVIQSRLEFPAGAIATQPIGQTGGGQVQRYLVNARAGQVMSVEVLEGPVSFDVRDPTGQLVEGAERIVFWEAELPMDGDYQIDVLGSEMLVDFVLDVRVVE